MASTKQMPLLMRRRGSRLEPLDAWTEERLREVSDHDDLNVVVTLAGKESPRRGANRLYWAGLGLMAKSIDDEKWPTSRKLHELIMENLGYTTKRWRIDNTFELVPDSIAQEEMGDDDFRDFFERAKVWVGIHFGVDPWAEWKAQKDAQRGQ